MSNAARTNPPLVKEPSTEGAAGGDHVSWIRIAPQSPGVQRRLSEHIGSTGTSIAAQEQSHWKLGGGFSHRKWIYVELPASGLRPLADVTQLPRGRALQLLERYCTTLDRLAKREERPPAASNLHSIFFDEENRLFFLPREVEDLLVKNLPDDEQRLWYQPGMLPVRPAEEAGGYQCAALLYAVLLGSSPTSPPSYEKSTGKSDTSVIAHPHLKRPELKEEPAETLYHLLTRELSPTYAATAELIQRYQLESLEEPLDPHERERRLSTARARYRKAAGAQHRRQLVKRHGPALATSIAVVGVLLLLFSPFISGKKEPSVTVGRSPEEVIRLFYESHNTLAHEVMAECTAGRAASTHMNEVTILFVINRVRRGVEGITPFMSAEEWKERGRPAPGRDTFVYGVDELSLEPLGDQTYRAEYTKYSTLPPERPETNSTDPEDSSSVREEAQDLRSTGRVRAFHVQEQITMKQTNEGWKIDTIEVEERNDTNP